MKLGATFRLQGDEPQGGAAGPDGMSCSLRWLDGKVGGMAPDRRRPSRPLDPLAGFRRACSTIPTDILEKFAPKLRPYVDRIAALPQISQYYAGRR